MGVSGSVLLDTHAVVWALTAPDRLGDRARQVLEDPTTTPWVSAASAWELAIKVASGRFPEAEPLVASYEALVGQLGARHLGIEPAIALRAGALGWAHRDPFDRVLAAQSLLLQLPLVTSDRAFGDLGGLEVIW